MERNGKRNGMEIAVWKMEDARMEWKISKMEWKTIFHTSIPIPYLLSRIVFTEKYILMSGSDKNIVAEVFNFNISALTICRQIAVLWLCTLRKQCTYCIIVSTLQFNCSIDVTADDLDRFDLFFLFFFLRLTICPVVNFVCLHRHENSYLLFHPRFA